jgi:cell wall-associated NlpC family hydrolase
MMIRNGADIAKAARLCVGVRFRPQGRDPSHGLDCVGLAGVAFARSALPQDYALRGGDDVAITAKISAVGLGRIGVDDAREGDLLLLETGARQFHLAVLTDRGFVHADAGLRRVVETPGRPRWPVLAAWRDEGG